MAEMMYCTCTNHKQKEGFTQRGWWFVKPGCFKPTRAFVMSLFEGPRNMPRTDLNLFQHGDHHNELWTIAELLYGRVDGESATWITDYRWTDEVIYGSESGRAARVWRHQDAPEKVDEN